MKRNILFKIWNFVTNKINDFKQDRYFKKQARRTLSLRKTKSSDFSRWENQKELFSNWDERTKILAAYIKPGAKIIEFGAGNMAIKRFLPENCIYTPTDIYLRSEEFLLCDLNEKINLPISRYDTAIFSGVLEYVYDVETVFKQLEPYISYVIVSYACSDLSNANRLKRGWLSDFSKSELELIFSNRNYEIIDEQEWRNQSIFYLKNKKYKK